MARNIEIKARAQHFEQLRERAAQLAPDAPLIFRQQDFFYDVPRGRLKLRQFDDGTPAELIFYQRDDRDGPKASYYTRSPVTNPEAMHALLATALTTRGIVTKERHVYLTGRTRIHLSTPAASAPDQIRLAVLPHPVFGAAGMRLQAFAVSELGGDLAERLRAFRADLDHARTLEEIIDAQRRREPCGTRRR